MVVEHNSRDIFSVLKFKYLSNPVFKTTFKCAE